MTPAAIYRRYTTWISAGQTGRNDSPEALAGWCLLHKSTFRISAAAAADWLLGLRMLRRLQVALREQGPGPMQRIEGGDTTIAIFDNKAKEMALRVQHVEENTGTKPGLFVSRDRLLQSQYPGKQQRPGVLRNVFRLLGRSGRVARLLLPREVHEAAAMLHLLSTEGIREVHFYSPYEKDANALALLLREAGIRVNKIPSPSLLAVHHRELIADTLSLGSPYQADELTAHADTILVARVQHWTPEFWPVYGRQYREAHVAPPLTLGFYSHGVWLREAEGHADSGFGDHTAEQQAGPALATFLRAHPEVQLTIFLHPRERKPAHTQRTQEHYERLFAGIPFRFANAALPNAEQFAAVDVGIGGISTILFERLFAGFKTVFFPAGVTTFPLPQSALAHVCPTTIETLTTVLGEALGQPASTYFETTGLARYTAHDWLREKSATR